MVSKFFAETYTRWNEHRLDNLKGYRDAIVLIRENAEAGKVAIKKKDSWLNEEEDEWSIELAALVELQKHGFIIELDGAGKERSSLSLAGVNTVTIRWDHQS